LITYNLPVYASSATCRFGTLHLVFIHGRHDERNMGTRERLKDGELLIAGCRHNCNIAKCHFTMPPGIRNHQGSIPCTLLSTLFHFRSNPTEILAHKSPIPEFITISSALSSTPGSIDALIVDGLWQLDDVSNKSTIAIIRLLSCLQ